ncbi:hypothetical protein HanPI659440_Chr00c05g0714291 [Helianthus annuus]|nr:hypothetical protein HanPI659440_Chr00c05g0714291 [Helianthus annuus]
MQQQQQMEQKSIACGNRLPCLSANYPWLVAQNQDGTGDQTFYTLHDHLCHYKCRIPKLLGNHIRGYFHGWVILSNNKMWSVWNPLTSKIINLPPLTLNNSESVGQCCLSSPLDDPVPVLLLTITETPTFLFCRLGVKSDRLSWRRMPYNRQLKKIIGHYNGFLQCPTFYNGKVYAMCNDGDHVIQVDIIVNGGEVLIKLLLYGRRPTYASRTCFPISIPLLKGTCSELFYIVVAFNEVTKKTLGDVYLFKWVTSRMRWEKMVDIKDAVLFVDLARGNSVYYRRAISSELGGYIHIHDEMGKMYSYNVEDKTISLSFMAYPTSHVSLWECRYCFCFKVFYC